MVFVVIQWPLVSSSSQACYKAVTLNYTEMTLKFIETGASLFFFLWTSADVFTDRHFKALLYVNLDRGVC